MFSLCSVSSVEQERVIVKGEYTKNFSSLTMRKLLSILALRSEMNARGDRSSIGRALDCGSSGCGFKPHRSPSFVFGIALCVTFPIVCPRRTHHASKSARTHYASNYLA